MARIADTVKKDQKLISYRYEAATSQGRLVKGTVKAISEIEAERNLIGRGLRPVNVAVIPSMFSLEEALPSLFQVKPRDVIVFSRQLATLLKSGISLLPAMEILQGQVVTSRAFRTTLGAIVEDLRSGGSFAQSIAKHPKVFNEIYVRTLTVGEQTGSLELVLNRIADHLEKQGAIAKKMKGALSYPIMVLGVGLVVAVILMVAVMPKLLDMFISMDTELPLPTRIMIDMTEVLTSYPLYFVIGGSVLTAAILWMIKQPSGRRILDKLIITLPVIGPPMLMADMARFARTMAMLIAAGLSLQEIMDLVPQTSNNIIIRNALNQVREGLLLGEGLSGPMARIAIFPPLIVQMVAVGEESNTLDFTMGVVADFYEVTSDEKMNALVSMIGPMSTVLIALFVGFIAMSVMMPMYSITGSF